MAKKASITVNPQFIIGHISPRLYGAFLEPIGSMVNGCMYNPNHPTADEKGFRKDFYTALKDAALPAIRLPGGNFVSGWDWKDSIGPMAKRKAHLDLAWHQYIPNDVGHDEYLHWAERAGTEAMYTINLGTGDINDAISIVEYTNHEGGTYWSDLRKDYGRKAPYGVKTWYLGNEMDGPWQIASWEKNPRGYGILAHEVSKAMKWVDPAIETVACVSSSPLLDHYPQWDLEVLQECYETVDYISLHHYHSAPEGDYAALLGGTCFFEDYINTEIALCDFVQTKLRSSKKMMLSFDEYGSHPGPKTDLHPAQRVHSINAGWYNPNPEQKYVRHDPDKMPDMSRFYRGEMLQALSSASTMLLFMRHADRVKIGCMTGGINMLAAANQNHVWKPAGYYPFAQLIQYGRGESLQAVVECETFAIPGYTMSDHVQYSTHEGIGYIDSAAAFDRARGEITFFVINRDWKEDCNLDIDLSGFTGYSMVEAIELFSEDPEAKNSYEKPDVIVPSVNRDAKFDGTSIRTCLKPLSWNVFRLKR
jgi:alpha-N-arabinofuranosidase